jgi:hypothetical protein
MSTTTDFKTAVEYSACMQSGDSGHCLIFKICTLNGLQHGADVQWLSAFPGEAEVLFPPLTYLQPTGKIQVLTDIKPYTFTIVEVHPTIA